jgi:hypothetical protein
LRKDRGHGDLWSGKLQRRMTPSFNGEGNTGPAAFSTLRRSERTEIAGKAWGLWTERGTLDEFKVAALSTWGGLRKTTAAERDT